MDAESNDLVEPELLARWARLGLALVGLFSLLLGLAVGFYVLLGYGMSAGHGGNPFPSIREVLVAFLPAPLIGVGVIGLICTTMRRLVAMCLFAALFLLNVSVLASL